MVIADSGSVHPRLRGELFAGEQDSFSNFGSSPLTRGTHRLTPDAQKDRRFIPAYAGNSFYGDGDFFMWSVHPRLRGELGMAAKIAAATAGSSPLTRGTHYLLTQHPRRARFIPAYAGNSWFTVPLRMPRGSSPLTGNSKSRPGRTHSITVHPRLRGELFVNPFESDGNNGSSPLTRGTR